MMRTLVDIPEEDVRSLDELGRRRSLSRSKIIRDAVREYLERNFARGEAEAFGLWGDRDVDGLDYQRRVRAEW